MAVITLHWAVIKEDGGRCVSQSKQLATSLIRTSVKVDRLVGALSAPVYFNVTLSEII